MKIMDKMNHPASNTQPSNSFSTRSETRPSDRLLVELLMQGAAVIGYEQLPTGEIPCLRRTAGGAMDYCQSPFVSTFVHDVLGYFDSQCPWIDSQILDKIPAPSKRWFFSMVSGIRRRIRAFIAWQESMDGTWRFFGRGSGIDPDSSTTACAAAVLLERPVVGPTGKGCQRYLDALKRFRSSEGIYFTFINKDNLGYGWMDKAGYPVVGYDPIVNALILRYLAMVGGDIDTLVEYVENGVNSKDFQKKSRIFLNPLCFYYILARTWSRVQLPGLKNLASIFTPQILGLQNEGGDFGGPLSTAMALSALLDFECTGDEAFEEARLSLLRMRRSWGGWEYEDFIINGYGASAWSTALSLVVLARCDSEAGRLNE